MKRRSKIEWLDPGLMELVGAAKGNQKICKTGSGAADGCYGGSQATFECLSGTGAPVRK